MAQALVFPMPWASVEQTHFQLVKVSPKPQQWAEEPQRNR
jgi:hypothetical protein